MITVDVASLHGDHFRFSWNFRQKFAFPNPSCHFKLHSNTFPSPTALFHPCGEGMDLLKNFELIGHILPCANHRIAQRGLMIINYKTLLCFLL